MALTQTARTLLSGLIDYAGLFPPAKLGMPQAVEAYARHRAGEHEWMLGRFICPASWLAEFTKAAAPLMPGTFATSGYREHAGVSEPWRLSVLIDGPLEANLEAVERFNAHHAAEDRGLARVDMIELKASNAAEIDAAMDVLPANLFPHFEIPVAGDPRGLIAALAGQGIAAKIRTGGVTPEAFPTPEQVAAFLVACAGAEVPFKATAGLHHPVCGPYRLTYEPSSPSCTMHGFLNLFTAAALIRAGRADAPAAAAVLRETDHAAFTISDRGLAWRDRAIDAMGLARVRETFALSFGSCSFDEPVDELKAMGVL
jgi:hypothetical protein